MPQIKTFEDACAKESVNPTDIIPFVEPKNGDQKAVNAFAKLVVINRALNDGWVPDWDDSNEWKYYPWFYMRSKAAGGPGFSCYDYYCVDSSSSVGSRLVFKTEELAQYAGEQFLDIYKDFMIIE